MRFQLHMTVLVAAFGGKPIRSATPKRALTERKISKPTISTIPTRLCSLRPAPGLALTRWAATTTSLWIAAANWEGDTLVVDTTNFRPETRFRGATEILHVVERFTRVDPNTILYKATIDDPSTFSKPWTMEFPFVAAAGPVYEYACHEGNYAMTDILDGDRKLEKEAGAK